MQRASDVFLHRPGGALAVAFHQPLVDRHVPGVGLPKVLLICRRVVAAAGAGMWLDRVDDGTAESVAGTSHDEVVVASVRLLGRRPGPGAGFAAPPESRRARSGRRRSSTLRRSSPYRIRAPHARRRAGRGPAWSRPLGSSRRGRQGQAGSIRPVRRALGRPRMGRGIDPTGATGERDDRGAIRPSRRDGVVHRAHARPGTDRRARDRVGRQPRAIRCRAAARRGSVRIRPPRCRHIHHQDCAPRRDTRNGRTSPSSAPPVRRDPATVGHVHCWRQPRVERRVLRPAPRP